MLKMLECEHDVGDTSTRVRIENPSWPEIEAAIRRLNRRDFPMVYLHAKWLDVWNEAGCDEPEHALCIWGGRGEYALEAWFNDRIARFRNYRRIGPEVNLAERDAQGGFAPAEWRSDDLASVLDIAREFSETGELQGTVSWELERR